MSFLSLSDAVDQERAGGDSGERLLASSRSEENHSLQHYQHNESPRYSVGTLSAAEPRWSYYFPCTSHAEHLPLHIMPPGATQHNIHACPSCKGTVGSAPSSRSSNIGSRSQIGRSVSHGSDFMSIDCTAHCRHVREYKDYHRERATAPVWTFHSSNFASSTYLNTASSYTQEYPPSSASHVCSHHPHSTAMHAHHVPQLYIPLDYQEQVSALCTARTSQNGIIHYLQEQEALRAASAAAVCGSCSSDVNHSETSRECDYCRHSCASTTVGDSNRSTYGSSRHKESSDVSSFDSNIYCGKDSFSSSDERIGNSSAAFYIQKLKNVKDKHHSFKQHTSSRSKHVSSQKSPVLNKKEALNECVTRSVREFRSLDSSSSLCLSDESSGSCSWESLSSSSSPQTFYSCSGCGRTARGGSDKAKGCDGDCASGDGSDGGGEGLASQNSESEGSQQIFSRSKPASQKSSQTFSSHHEHGHQYTFTSSNHMTGSSHNSSCSKRRRSPLLTLRHRNAFSHSYDLCRHGVPFGTKYLVTVTDHPTGSSDPGLIVPSLQHHSSLTYSESLSDTSCAFQHHSAAAYELSSQTYHYTRAMRHCQSPVLPRQTSQNYHFINRCSICKRQHMISSQPALLESSSVQSHSVVCHICCRTKIEAAAVLTQASVTPPLQSLVLFKEPQGKITKSILA